MARRSGASLGRLLRFMVMSSEDSIAPAATEAGKVGQRSAALDFVHAGGAYVLGMIRKTPSRILRSLDHDARPWKRAQEHRALEEARGRKRGWLRHSLSFGVLLLVISSAMMAALMLPERDPVAAAVDPKIAGMAVSPVQPSAETVAGRTLQLSTSVHDEWQPVRRPVQVFHLEGPETEGADFAYRVSARGRDARQDMLIFTPRPDRLDSRPRITMAIERYESTQPTQRPLFADLAQRAADQHGVLERMSEAAEIVTKFGPMQVADAILTFDGKSAACMVYRRLDTGGLVIAGWYCAPARRPVDRVALACFINRLDLVSAGNDRELRRHFAESERNRGTCVSARQSGRRITWLDHEAPVPPLKLGARNR